MPAVQEITKTENTDNNSGSRSGVLKRIALAGNPNAGKTTLFNALTGMRQRVGNYPGVTVEKKDGRCQLVPGRDALILDLPGTYSLSPKSPDEEIARDVLLGLRSETPPPDIVVIVVDASNLERNLYLATQIIELGIPAIIALNMSDVAAKAGKLVDPHELSLAMGVPVVPLVAVRGEGVPLLKATLLKAIPSATPPSVHLPAHLQEVRDRLAQALDGHLDLDAPPISTVPEEDEEGLSAEQTVAYPNDPMNAGLRGIALRLLCSDVPARTIGEIFNHDAAGLIAEVRANKELAPLAASVAESRARYSMLGSVVKRVESLSQNQASKSFTDRADAILTHRVWGLIIFAALTLLVFQAIFSWANIPMDWIDGNVSALKDAVKNGMAEGPLRDLLADGVIAGVGGVVIFLPQILILFFFIGLLEDTGYMARAAFIMDRLMAKVGLHGRAFIPLMSSFACAIPGIMATRTIANRRDRMTTILIAPLMACSARLPVYTLMIGTFIPATKLGGFHVPLGPLGVRYFGLTLPAAVMFSLYALGVIVAMAAAFVFKKTLFAGPPPVLMMELPPYKMPAWKNVVITMWDRGSEFLKRAGTIILAISIILWFMLSYPKDATEQATASAKPALGTPTMSAATPEQAEEAQKAVENQAKATALDHSFAGKIGHAVEPAIAPIGFNWKIGIGLIGAMAAREVFVATIGTVYAVGDDADEESVPLREAMKKDKWPDGRPVWTTLTAISLMVYFVIAMQCISTLAIVKRETNSWKWPAFMLVYLTVLAWVASFLVYQVGRILGYG